MGREVNSRQLKVEGEEEKAGEKITLLSKLRIKRR
jgi:hypothetical protein